MILLLFPAIAETIDASIFSLSIPGLPFTLGRISFMIVGFIGINRSQGMPFSSNLFKGLFFVFLGGMIGGLFSNEILKSLSRSLGAIILFFASVGISRFWDHQYFKKFLDAFFIIDFVYWIFYVFNLTISKGFSVVSYSQLYLSQEAINHHTVGINLSSAALYLAVRYFYLNNVLQFWGYLVLFLGVIACFVSETRSNLLFILFSFSIIVLYSKIKLYRFFLIIIPVLTGMILFLLILADKNEGLFQRFDLTDKEYQQNTTGMRLEFIVGFFEAFINNPFGKGVFGTQISHASFQSVMLHNQYLTFLLSGGLISLYGLYFWVYELKKVFTNFIKSKIVKPFDKAVVFSSFTFFITLLTLEHSGLLFFLFISFALYLNNKKVSDYRSLTEGRS